MTIREAARLALTVQDACNLSGVVHAWSRIMELLWEEARRTGQGTDFVNNHPICVLFASKVASLTHCESASRFSEAWDAATLLAEEHATVAA